MLQFSLLSAIALSAVMLSVVTAIVAWRRRWIPGAAAFAAMTLAAGWWSAGVALEHASLGVSDKIF
jgi:hypothetical protein